MFDRLGGTYPCFSLVECLIVFASLFLAGCLWMFLLQWYVNYRLEDSAHA